MNGRALQGPPAATQTFALPRLRANLRVFRPQPNAEDQRFTLYDARNDLSYFLGASELLVAQLFDGQRDLHDIASHLAREHGKLISVEKLQAFEARLFQLGLLEQPGRAPGKPLADPSIGISYGPLKSMLMVTVLRLDNPAPMLDWLHRSMPWLRSGYFVGAGAALISLAITLLLLNLDPFLRDAGAIFGGGATWLLWHYPIVVVSIFFHEIGHALACRHYRVRITSFGIAVYLLLAMGWARPLQADWSTLGKRQRLTSIALGPFASLLFAAIGVFIWFSVRTFAAEGDFAPASAVLITAGTVIAVSSTVALIPTLLPFFNGDTYLAITELLGIPRLRQRAFRYARAVLRRRELDEPVSQMRKWLYGITVAGTLFGWIAIWLVLAHLARTIVQWLQS